MPDDKKKPDWLPGGEPAPATDAAVAAPDDARPRGERQDGAGIAPPRADRTDAELPGTTADARSGPRQGTGSRDPFAADRGDPARIATGAAQGSGAGENEEPGRDGKSSGGKVG